MPTRLIQVVTFVNVAPLATVALPHNININDIPKRPDFVAADIPDFDIVVSATTVTVTNNGGAPTTINVWLELKHTIPRELAGLPNLTPQPFIASAGSSGGGGGGAVIFDDSVPGTNVNIRSDRAANQSPIDNTKAGITNLSSKTGTVDPLAPGATGNYSTIGGGDDNGATGDYSTVSGGRQNLASGLYAEASGFGSRATAEGAHAEGSSLSQGQYAHTEGFGEVDGDANAEASHAEGSGFVDNASNAHAEGQATVFPGADFGHAEGRNSRVQNNARYAHAEGNNTQCDVGAEAAHSEGDGSIAGAHAAHAEGNGTTAGGDGAHSEGTFSEAAGDFSHAQNGATFAQGEGSHAEGDGTRAQGDYSHAQGSVSLAHRETQFSHASGDDGGFGTSSGYAQTSWLLFRGQTSGGANVVLHYGLGPAKTFFDLENLRSYDLRITLVANGKQAGPVYLTRTLKQNLNARCVGGVASILGTGFSDSYGDAAANVWTLTVTTSGSNLIFTFSPTTDNLSEINIACHVEWTEIRFFA